MSKLSNELGCSQAPDTQGCGVDASDLDNVLIGARYGRLQVNLPFARLVLDGLICGVESNSEIPVQLSELKLLKTLLGSAT